MIRLFIALPVPLPVAEQLAALVPAELQGLKRVGPELMHITLAFIGWIDELRVEHVALAVRQGVSGSEAFEVDLGTVGRFPPTGRPRVVWVGTGAAAERIERLADAVRNALAEAAVPFDQKPVRPHITLTRVREGIGTQEARAIASAAARAKVPEPLAFRADVVQVMQSTLTPHGPRYSSRASVPLGGG